MINIIVVADKDLSTFARRLVHSLSKTGEIKSSFISTNMFKQNENQMTGNNYIIFLGKNEVSEDYVDLIKVDYDRHGIKWGHDYRKAIIYVDSFLKVNEDLLNLELSEVKSSVTNLKNALSKQDRTDIALAVISLFIYPPAFFTSLIFSVLLKKRKLKKLQYELGISTFLLDKKGLSALIDEK